jgi:hypothetical protein
MCPPGGTCCVLSNLLLHYRLSCKLLLHLPPNHLKPATMHPPSVHPKPCMHNNARAGAPTASTYLLRICCCTTTSVGCGPLLHPHALILQQRTHPPQPLNQASHARTCAPTAPTHLLCAGRSAAALPPLRPSLAHPTQLDLATTNPQTNHACTHTPTRPQPTHLPGVGNLLLRFHVSCRTCPAHFAHPPSFRSHQP